ncbi:hypothetical protein [Paracoccus methylarcula]|uniref:Uncharacterized protein n=1 Tax=Paracoccus methylarcula TaxID=72022 RepID=A0A3R7Q3L7_9RHOB|nr:hypothetical protein [Paracoccus methylarcula]RNF35383.1 hypothetical protein A7A09_007295 [Paracoccus methylarcula]
MIFTVVDIKGEIVSTLDVPDLKTAELNIQDGQRLYEGHFDGSSQYFVGNTPTPYPERPGDWAEFDYEQGVWIDPRSNEERRVLALKAITDIRGATRSRYVTVTEGQQLSYLDKERQAKEWLAAMAAGQETGIDEPDAGQYPALAYETGAGLTADNPTKVAEIIVAQAEKCRLAFAVIEGVIRQYLNAAKHPETIIDVEDIKANCQRDVDHALSAEGL